MEEPVKQEESQGPAAVLAQPGISCALPEFEPKICRPEKTAVLFLGSEAEHVDEILGVLDELQETAGMDFAVLDMADDKCADLSAKYSIDRQASQIVVFQNCQKVSGIALEGDIKQQVAKLKASLEPKPAETNAAGVSVFPVVLPPSGGN